MTEAELHEHAATHGDPHAVSSGAACAESCARAFPTSGPLREAIMLAIPPSLLGQLAAVSIIAASCLLSLNHQPWRGGKAGC